MRLRLPARQSVAVLSAGTLLASLIALAAPPAARASSGPSIPLQQTASVAQSEQSMSPAPIDGASSATLQGDQAPRQASDGASNYQATSLAASADWKVSPQTGTFSWSYPMEVPPSPGGLDPSVTLSYTSSAVDGRTNATNNQASVVGDGWELGAGGFVERSYGGCADDTAGGTTAPKTGDLCWRSDNATASYPGGGGALINGGSLGWHAKNDDGSRVDHLTSCPGNGDNDNECWRIITADGTQYYFGSRPESNSTWTAPVFGDDAGEPCNSGAGFAASSCMQGWRWNLDKIIDRHGNMTIFSYDAEKNSYGRNLQDSAVSYTRSGTLREIEYGLRADEASIHASGRVVFGYADRCVPGSNCTPTMKENWPDVPWTASCTTATCHGNYAPTFWSTKRLATVTTGVWNGTAYDNVDAWTLDYQYPDPGDGEKASLWLHAVSHTGLVGTPITLPPVTFMGSAMANRVAPVDGIAPLLRYRITGIMSEAGGLTSVNYAQPDCSPTSLPANPQTNTRRCFPVNWSDRLGNDRTDYFHKYVVASVVSSDRLTSTTAQVRSYEYLDGAGWHYDMSEFTPAAKKTWNEFRGFGRVRIRNGSANDPSGPVTMTEQRYYRGMDGDHLPVGTRAAIVTDSEGGARADSDWLNGFDYETSTHDGTGENVVEKSITDPVWRGPTATRGVYQAYFVAPGTVRAFTALKAGGWRTTRTVTTYDVAGQPTQVNDFGDAATATDDLCTNTVYVRNDSVWLRSLPVQTETVAVNCDVTPTYPHDAVSGTRWSYDQLAWSTPPSRGDVSAIDRLDQYPAEGAAKYTRDSSATYDRRGRVTESTDALGNATKTAYTPALAGPVTQTVKITPGTAAYPNGFATTTILQPARGLPTVENDPNGRKTESIYDALGELTQVWLPNRKRATYPTSGSYKFSYSIHSDAPTVVTSQALNASGHYTNRNVLYDGLLRQRQTQSPAEGGGRLVVDTRYDSQGRPYQTTNPYFNNSAPDGSIWLAADIAIPGLTELRYDSAGRLATETFKGNGTPLWHTDATYDGDRVSVTPPAGGTPTTTVTDARGRTIALLQHHGAQATGAFDRTTYTYEPDGRLAAISDAAGNTWSYTYDLHGRQTSSDDVDKGHESMTYDANGRVKTHTDARGVTLAYNYDKLGRMIEERRGSSGQILASWSYDTAIYGKGLPATGTRYDDAGNAYISQTGSYTALNKPLDTSVTIPQSEGLLAGTYPLALGYNVDGTISTEEMPAIGDLPAEVVSHAFDELGLPTQTTGGSAGTTFYVNSTVYSRYGEPQRLELGRDTKRVWLSYYMDDQTRRITRSIVDAEVAHPMQLDLNYGYDLAGNVTRVADTTLDRAADTQCFRYDYLRRLTEAWTPGNGCAADPSMSAVSGPAPYWQSFTYDLNGNRRSSTVHVATGNTTSTYTYPIDGGASSPHTLTALSVSAPSGTTVSTYRYDASGDLTSRAGQTVTWDPEGHLSSVTAVGKTTSYVYDSSGSRLMSRDATGATLYLPGQELHVDQATGAKTATRYYEHGGSSVAVRTATGLTWLAADYHGTDNVAIDTASQAVSIRRSDPFGNSRGSVPASWRGDRGFVGGTVDSSSSGLTHLGARDYDPALGRFISVDPVLDPSDPQQMNGYAYANSNPTTFSDPSGMFYFLETDGNSTAPGAAANRSVVAPATSSGGSIDRAQTRATKNTAYQKSLSDLAKRAALRDKRYSLEGTPDLVYIPNEPAPVPVDWACASTSGIYSTSGYCTPDQIRRADQIVTGRYDDYLARREHASISLCGSVGAVIFGGASAEGCVSVDIHGVTVNGNASAEVSPKIGGSFGLDLRHSTSGATAMNRMAGNVRAETKRFPGLGRFNTGSISVQVGVDPDTGRPSNTHKLGLLGVDFGKVDLTNFAGKKIDVPWFIPDKIKYSEVAGNSGYIFRW